MTKMILLSLLSVGRILGTELISFDNLATPLPWVSVLNVWNKLPSSYAGLRWVGWEVMNQNAFSILYQDETPIPSSPNFAYPGLDSAELSVSSRAPFLFIGAQFAGWPTITGPAASSVTISGYFQGDFVGSVSLSLSATDWCPAGGVDGLVDTLIFTSADGYFRMDNLEISRAWLPRLRPIKRGGETGDRRPVQLFHE